MKNQWKGIALFVGIMVLMFAGMRVSETNRQEISKPVKPAGLSVGVGSVPDLKPVFDLNVLYGKNIYQLRKILGHPSDGNMVNPTALQVKIGVDEWDNSFEKDGKTLLVTYSVKSKKVKDFFLATDSGRGGIADTLALMQTLGVKSDKRFSVKSVRELKHPDRITGIIVTPR